MATIHGASWARLLRTDEEGAGPDSSGFGWHLWQNLARFPREDMGAGFRYLASEGHGRGGRLPVNGGRKTEAVHVVTDFQDFVEVTSVSHAYTVLRDRFGLSSVSRLIGSRMDWMDNAYNRGKTRSHTLLLAAWAYRSEPVEPVEIGDFGRTGTGWKRLEP